MADPDRDEAPFTATNAGEALDPRDGDDTVVALGGNDIIVASAGDDSVDGGAGPDRMVFAGELVEYDFSRDEPNGEIFVIFTHVDIGAHRFNEGSEVITGVEFFDFGTETFMHRQLEEVIFGRSALRGTSDSEFMFLQPGGDLFGGRNDLLFAGDTTDGRSGSCRRSSISPEPCSRSSSSSTSPISTARRTPRACSSGAAP